MRLVFPVLTTLTIMLSAFAYGADGKFGIEGKPAPKWEVKEWMNLPDGKTELGLSDFKGKVVYITFFQTMCGGCHQHGLPTLKKSIESFKDDPNVEFVAIQTAFESYDKNDMNGAKRTAEEFGLSIPIGHQGKSGAPAPILWSYDAAGTPWTVIIDKKGIVRFNQNYTTPKQAREKIDVLLSEKEKSSAQ